MNQSFIVRTLGCKANLADSQRIEAELRKRGWHPAGEAGQGSAAEPASPGVCIVNSCSVTDEADRQTRRLAARLHREHPGTAVVVTGCGAEIDPERLARSSGIRYVIGNRDKPALVDLILAGLERDGALENAGATDRGGEVLGRAEGYAEMRSRHPMDRDWPLPERVDGTEPGLARTTRAFLKIQEGCNSFCTYCIIPYGRGPSRSLRPREVLEGVRALVSAGIREVVLTGTNLGDYGSDWGEGPALGELLRIILGESPLERLRLSSLDPTEITSDILKQMESDPRLCPHFHVSLQSPDTRVLRLMKRRYGRAEVIACLEALAGVRTRVPGGVFVGMDVIAGFPGETAREFDAGRELLARLPWSRLHVFPYSERGGTPATRLPDAVDPAERTRRARELQTLSRERLLSIHDRVLADEAVTLPDVLLERPQKFGGERWVSGYAANYLRVLLPVPPADAGVAAEALAPNRLVQARLTGRRVDAVAGEVAFTGALA